MKVCVQGKGAFRLKRLIDATVPRKKNCKGASGVDMRMGREDLVWVRATLHVSRLLGYVLPLLPCQAGQTQQHGDPFLSLFWLYKKMPFTL